MSTQEALIKVFEWLFGGFSALLKLTLYLLVITFIFSLFRRRFDYILNLSTKLERIKEVTYTLIILLIVFGLDWDITTVINQRHDLAGVLLTGVLASGRPINLIEASKEANFLLIELIKNIKELLKQFFNLFKGG